MKNIVWYPQAREDLTLLRDHISQDDPVSAKKVVLRLFSAIEVLAEHPAMGRPGRVLGTRELHVPKTSCLIPYLVKDENVFILRVFHESQNLPDDWCDESKSDQQ